jgi:hypothetical protein
MDDLDTARIALVSHLQRLEELVRAQPDDVATRAMLSEGWARYGLLFLEDDVEDAKERSDASTASYHSMRARNAHERAIHHGTAALGSDAHAFEQAVAQDGVVAFLDKHPDLDRDALLWLGAGWLGRVRNTPESDDRRELSLRAHIGEQLIERAIAGDSPARARWGHLLLGLWRGRVTGGDPVRAQQNLTRSLELSNRTLLLAQVILARTVVCQAHDREQWDHLFNEVLEARDPAPDLRLANAVAKKKAARDRNGLRRGQCVP